MTARPCLPNFFSDERSLHGSQGAAANKSACGHNGIATKPGWDDLGDSEASELRAEASNPVFQEAENSSTSQPSYRPGLP